MHAFSDEHLLLFDAFGLTRVTLPAKVKHNKKVVGQFMVQNGPLLVAHSHVTNNRFAMTVPEMKVVPIDDKWNYNLTYGYSVGVTPAGLPFEVVGTELIVYGIDGKQKAKLGAPLKRLKAKLDFGPVLPVENTQWSARVATGADGTFVVFGDGQLFGGKLSSAKKPALEHGWSVPAPRVQGQVHLRAGAFGAFVSVFHPAQHKAYCALIVDGTVKTEVVESLAPVDFDGARIAYQISYGEVCRKPFDVDAIERIGLPEGARAIGTVMADGDRLLFLTADRERIRDLVNDEVIERGLPADEQRNRTKVLAFIETLREPASVANLDVSLAALRPPAYGEGPRPDWGWDEGDQSVLRTCVIGNLLARSYDDRELSAGSYSPPQFLARPTEASIERVFEAVDAHGLDLIAGVSMLETALDSHWNARYRSAKKPLFEKPAARMLLWGIIESVGAKQPTLAGRAWASQELTAEILTAKIDPAADGWRRGHYADAQKATAYLVLDYLEDKALPVFLDWLLERPSGRVTANMHIFGDLAEALIAAYPKTKAPFAAALAKAAAGKDADRAQRATSLQSRIT